MQQLGFRFSTKMEWIQNREKRVIYITGFSRWCLHTELRQWGAGQGQTINSYTNKPINKFKVHALLDDTLSCTHRVFVIWKKTLIYLWLELWPSCIYYCKAVWSTSSSLCADAHDQTSDWSSQLNVSATFFSQFLFPLVYYLNRE